MQRPNTRSGGVLHLAVWLLTATPLLAQVPLPEMGALQGSGISILSQNVSVSVAPISVISVSSGGITMSLASGLESTDNGTSYSISVNGSSKKLTGSLDVAYSAGISLDLELDPPTGATSFRRTLSTAVQDLVSGIDHTAASNLTITYIGTAQPDTPPNGPGETRTVTITLTDS